MSYCQSRELRVYLQQMIMGSREKIGQLPSVQSTEQIVLILADIALISDRPFFLLLLKPEAWPISDLKV